MCIAKIQRSRGVQHSSKGFWAPPFITQNGNCPEYRSAKNSSVETSCRSAFSSNPPATTAVSFVLFLYDCYGGRDEWKNSHAFLFALCLCPTVAPNSPWVCPNSPAVPVQEILDQWAAALGGRQKIADMESIHLRAKLESGGMKGTFDRWVASKGELHETVDIAGAYHQESVLQKTQA